MPPSSQLQTLPLKVVTRQKDEQGNNHVQTVHLILRDNSPVKLGSGRYAQVFVAASTSNLRTAEHFYALKFLKQDQDSNTVSRNARKRFFEELDKTVKFGAEKSKFIQYVGYSRLKALPDFATHGKSEREKAEDAFEDLLKPAGVLSQTVEANIASVKDVLEPSFLKRLQGDFFAMGAEEGTLEDVLFDVRPWSERPIYSVRPGLRNEFQAHVRRNQKRVGEFLSDIQDRKVVERISPRDAALGMTPTKKSLEEIAKNCSGFAILKLIGLHSPSVKNFVVLSLMVEIAETVGQVHTNTSKADRSEPDEGWLAHRDLKPGNFLFSQAGPRLRVSDLGFVGGKELIRSGMNSGSESVHEPGVLSPGSPLFRAPEQLPALEVRFEVVEDGEPKVSFTNIGGIAEVEVGDWFECQEVGFGSAFEKSHHKSQIIGVTESDGVVELRFKDEDKVYRRRNSQARDTYVGYLIKSSGQHTDVFAVGCMLYLLVTMGRNPEKFYLKCLEREAIRPLDKVPGARSSEGRLFYDLLHGDCFSLALSLCLDKPDAIAEDLAPLLGSGAADIDAGDPGLDRDDVISRTALLRPEVFPFVQRSIKSISSARFRALKRAGLQMCTGAKAQDLHRYLYFLRESPTTQTYLRDVNGKPIPFSIIWEIVRCVVRDRPGSYVRRMEPKRQSFFDVEDGHLTAERIAGRLGTLLEKVPSAKPNLSDYKKLDSGNGARLFYAIRTCLGSYEPSPDPASPPGEKPKDVPRPAAQPDPDATVDGSGDASAPPPPQTGGKQQKRRGKSRS